MIIQGRIAVCFTTREKCLTSQISQSTQIFMCEFAQNYWIQVKLKTHHSSIKLTEARVQGAWYQGQLLVKVIIQQGL